MPTQKKSVSSAVSVSSVPCLIDHTQILTLAQLAERLQVSERWIYEKSRRRNLDPLPVIRLGRYLRFDWGDISSWIEQRKTVRP